MNAPFGSSREPETLDGFSGWQEIGRGGDATVYKATQDALQRDVAIKVLTVEDEESVRRFTREVQLMVSLGRQHPNIANVLQIGTSSHGRPCIVMDFFELGSLDQRLARYGQLPADEVVQVGTLIADALAFAHARGVLHRDVKPQNILVMPTSYVLSDFGIARLIDSAHTASTDRFSYRHASPQVLEGAPPSESDDIFSLGATLFHLLDGKPPFTLLGDEPDSALAYIKRAQTLAPRRIRRNDLPPGLVAIIDRALQKDPSQRFASAAEMRDALSDVRTETRAWSGDGAPRPNVPVPQLSTPTGSHTWGGVPGQTRDPADFTSMRLMDNGTYTSGRSAQTAQSAYSARSAASASAPPQHEQDEDEPKGMPLLAFGLAGITVGVIVVVIMQFMPNPPWSRSDPTPGPTTASPTKSPTNAAYDPNYQPRNLRIKDNGTSVDLEWDLPVKTPASYAISSASSRSQTASPAGAAAGTDRAKRIQADPKAKPLCFVVTGVSNDMRLGPSERKCIRE
ncbi:hypothetical protein GCM10027418_27290 [Mariniluteicoccus endophyticus]